METKSRLLPAHRPYKNKRSEGSVLIIVLWIIMLGLILITTIAKNSRLSAMTVQHHQEALQDWSDVLNAMSKAHMELIMSKTAQVNVNKNNLSQYENDPNRFDGRPLSLSYQVPDGLNVRIYNLSGKININNLDESKLTSLLQQQLGEDDNKIPELVDAWLDWVDDDDLKRLNGAEEAYYTQQKFSYNPRNGEFASVDEIRLIKGFTEIFPDVDLSNVFTLWGNTRGAVNPNFANQEVLSMLPGMDQLLAEKLIKARKVKFFENIEDVSAVLPPDTMTKLKGWFQLNKSNTNFYAIMVYPERIIDKEKNLQNIYTYMEEVKISNTSPTPVILSVNPYAKLTIENVTNTTDLDSLN